MVVREYIPEEYDIVSSWWKAHGWAPVPEKLLARTGLVAENDGHPVAAVWVYRTDSAVLLAEWLVADPEASPKDSYRAVTNLLDSVKLLADYSGCAVLMFVQEEGLLRKLEKEGFSVEERPHYEAAYFGGG